MSPSDAPGWRAARLGGVQPQGRADRGRRVPRHDVLDRDELEWADASDSASNFPPCNSWGDPAPFTSGITYELWFPVAPGSDELWLWYLPDGVGSREVR